MAKNPEIFSVTLSFNTTDSEKSIAAIATMLKNGVAIDEFHTLKGKNLLIYALKDFHKRWVVEKNINTQKKDANETEEEKPITPKKTRNFGNIVEKISP